MEWGEGKGEGEGEGEGAVSRHESCIRSGSARKWLMCTMNIIMNKAVRRLGSVGHYIKNTWC